LTSLPSERYGERAVRGLRAFVELAERRLEVLNAVREQLVNGGGCSGGGVGL